MKIQKDLFQQFLRKASINDKIIEGIINFEKDRMSFENFTIDNNMFCACVMDAKYIWEHQELGKIGIANMKLLRQVINRFEGDINILVVDNKLIIKDVKRTVEFATLDVSYIKEVPVDRLLSFEYPYHFEIDNNIMSEMITSCDTLNDKMKVFTIELYNDDILITSGSNKEAGNLNRFLTQEKIKGNIKEKQRILLGEYIIHALAVIDSPIEINFGNKLPFKIFEDFNKKIQTTIIISPRVENEE